MDGADVHQPVHVVLPAEGEDIFCAVHVDGPHQGQYRPGDVHNAGGVDQAHPGAGGNVLKQRLQALRLPHVPLNIGDAVPCRGHVARQNQPPNPGLPLTQQPHQGAPQVAVGTGNNKQPFHGIASSRY